MNKRTVPFILLAVFLAGCTVKPRPPLFSLYGRQKLVVMPVQNLTQDPALGPTVQDGIIGGLVRLNAVPIAEESAVSALIAKQRTTNLALEQDDKLRQKIVDSLKADTLMVGSVNTYTEDMREEEPQRLVTNYKAKTYKWGYNDMVTVTAMATVKVLDANTGNILWVRQARGQGVYRRWKDLAWPGDNPAPPPDGWDRLKGRGKPAAAEAAKGQAPAGGTPVSTGGGQTINIVINNVNQQSQTQTQQQEQKQEQAAGGAAAAPKLLYTTDTNVMRARDAAVGQVINTVLNDYRGAGGWYPGMTQAEMDKKK